MEHEVIIERDIERDDDQDLPSLAEAARRAEAKARTISEAEHRDLLARASDAAYRSGKDDARGLACAVLMTQFECAEHPVARATLAAVFGHLNDTFMDTEAMARHIANFKKQSVDNGTGR